MKSRATPDSPQPCVVLSTRGARLCIWHAVGWWVDGGERKQGQEVMARQLAEARVLAQQARQERDMAQVPSAPALRQRCASAALAPHPLCAHAAPALHLPRPALHLPRAALQAEARRLQGELLEAERGETAHVVEAERGAAEARAALQACEEELARQREGAEAARASGAAAQLELEARREAEAEHAAARAELRVEQLRLRQANTQMHALLGRLRTRLGEGAAAEAPGAWEGAAPSGSGSPRISRGAPPSPRQGSPGWGGSLSLPGWAGGDGGGGGGGSSLDRRASAGGVGSGVGTCSPPPAEAWGVLPGNGGRSCGCGAAAGDAERGAAATAAVAGGASTAAAAAAAAAAATAVRGKLGGVAGRAPSSSAWATPLAWGSGSEQRPPPPITPHRCASSFSTNTSATTATRGGGRPAGRGPSCLDRANGGASRLTPRRATPAQQQQHSAAGAPAVAHTASRVAVRHGTAPGAAARPRTTEPARFAPTSRSILAAPAGKREMARDMRAAPETGGDANGYGTDDAGACFASAREGGVADLFSHEAAAGTAMELTADRLLEIERRVLGL